jgi:2,5-diketo-D-gluconate reductase A
MAMRSYNERKGIATEAWSPIGQGRGLLDAPELDGVAKKHDKSAAQVVLRWHIQLGNIIFPKSVTPERVQENMDIFDFELSDEEMESIAEMEKAERLGPDPDQFTR